MTEFIILVTFVVLFGIAFIVFFGCTITINDFAKFSVGLFVATMVCFVCFMIFMVFAIEVWEHTPDCIKKQYDNHIEKVDNANKELQKFLIDHPEFKMEENK